MLVYGIIGPIGHGKSTVARYLADTHGFVEANFALPLKETVAAVYSRLGVEPRHFLGTQEDKAEPIERLGGITGRRILELVGTNGFRAAYEDTWLDIGFDVIHANDDRVVVGDLRFPNEAAAVRKRSGKIIRVFAEGKDIPPAEHESDEHWRSMVAEHEIRVPVGDLQALYRAVDAIVAPS